MSRVYYTADLHLGHARVAGLRGFATTQEHDAAILSGLAETLRPRDTLYVLGDLVGRAGAWANALALLRPLPGTLRLVTGNHDPAHPTNRSHGERTREALEVFASVAPFGTASIGGRRVLLSHFPYLADRGEPRFLQWRLRDDGGVLLHGHLHVAERVTSPREIHVGLDAWGLRPVATEELVDLLPGEVTP